MKFGEYYHLKLPYKHTINDTNTVYTFIHPHRKQASMNNQVVLMSVVAVVVVVQMYRHTEYQNPSFLGPTRLPDNNLSNQVEVEESIKERDKFGTN